MPQYSYLCAKCALQFDRTLSMGEHPTYPCPSCEEPACRQFEGQSFGHAFADTPGKPLANTGVHKDDYPTADRVVGKSALRRWDHFHARAEVKSKAREEGGTHALARLDNPQGGFTEYTPMSPSGLAARKVVAKETMKAMDDALAQSPVQDPAQKAKDAVARLVKAPRPQ